MTPYEYLTQCVMTRLQPSPIHGIGVFAIIDINAGEKVFDVWRGATGMYLITNEEYNVLSPELKDYVFAMYGPSGYFRLYNNCHFVLITPQYFINTKYDKGNVDCHTYCALTDIPKGTELFSNYGVRDNHTNTNKGKLI